MANENLANQKRIGFWLSGCGTLFGAAPLILSAIAIGLGSQSSGMIGYLFLMTAPIGFVCLIAGLVVVLTASLKLRSAKKPGKNQDKSN